MARVKSLIKWGMMQSPSDHLNSNSGGSSLLIGNYQNISFVYSKGRKMSMLIYHLVNIKLCNKYEQVIIRVKYDCYLLDSLIGKISLSKINPVGRFKAEIIFKVNYLTPV